MRFSKSYSGIFLLIFWFMIACDTADPGPELGPGELAPPDVAKLENSEFPGSLHVGMNTDYTRYLEPLGTLNGLMVFVDFPNALYDENISQLSSIPEYAEQVASNTNEFFWNGSYGRFQINLDHLDEWLTMPNEDTFYNLRRGEGLVESQTYREDALTMASAHVNLADYDFYVIIPPENATAIELSTATASPVHFSDTLSVNHIVIIGNEGGRDIDHLKLVHETLHLTGLPDLYDGFGSRDYTGGFDIMSTIYSFKLDNFAWLKWKMGWIDDHQVNVIHSPGITEHVISPLARSDNEKTKMVVIITSSRTAYVLENRTAEKNDILNFRDQGLLVYTVDVDKPSLRGPIWAIDPYEDVFQFSNRTLSFDPGRVSYHQNELLGIEVSILEMKGNGDIRVEVIQHP